MIVHILLDEKFTADFIAFINSNFICSRHLFLVTCAHKEMRYAESAKLHNNVITIHKNISGLYYFIKYILKAEKVILHGMFNKLVVFLILIMHAPHKTFWCIWGGDLYDYPTEKELWKKIKTKVISKLKGIVTLIEDDYEYAKRNYSASCVFFPCLLYISNICTTDTNFTLEKSSDTIHILLGNSADVENNHFYLIDLLAHINLTNLHITIPLSYGDQNYAQKVEEYAIRKLGNSVVTLRSFMPLKEYKAIISQMDIALYAHNRQQALGNIIQLISSGTKVFLNPKVSTYKWMQGLGINVYDVNDVSIESLHPLSISEKKKNQKLIFSRANISNLIYEWDKVFED